MPIIQISPEDLLKGQLHQEGWKKGQIVAASTAQSKDKQSMNYTYVLKYETGINRPGEEFREIKSQFNSKAMGFMTPFIAALQGKTTKEFIDANKVSGVKFEWDAVKDQKLQFKIENKPREDNGQLTSKVTDFLPYDYQIPF